MRRRDFVLGAGAVVAACQAAVAQLATKPKRIGWLSAGDPDAPLSRESRTIFLDKLKTFGWQQDAITFYVRYIDHDASQFLSAAKELIATNPDVIVAIGGTAAGAFKDEKRIPIVFTNVTDPVSQGFVSNLGHPGGNITGFSIFDATMASKGLGIFKEVVPNLARATCVFNPETALTADLYIQALRAAGSSTGIEVKAGPVYSDGDITALVETVARDGAAGLVQLPDGFFAAHSAHLIVETAKYRVPAFYLMPSQLTRGGLISYANDQTEQTVGAAAYVDQILRGRNPGDLPVQGPSKYQLSINLGTAKALGLTVPPGLIASADQVIE